MENISLLIVTDHRDYGEILARSILHICSRIFVQTVSKDNFFMMRKRKDIPEDSADSIDSADLILWDGQEAESSFGGRIVLLSDRQSMAVKNFSCKKFCIYKYSSVQSVVADIFEIFSFLTGQKAVHINCSRINILAFSSCSGGSGCTTLAMAVAQEICRFQNKRVMYISFEEIESTGDFMESPPGARGAGVYLYHLFKPDSLRLDDSSRGVYPVMESYIVRDSFGVEAFAPTAGRNPLRSLASDELALFMASVTGSGRYDVIIMDLGTGLSDINVSCMEMAERICIVSKDSGRREDQYIQYLICRYGENIVDKLVKVSNMTFTEDNLKEGEQETSMLKSHAVIEKSDTFLQSGEVGRIFLDGKFGSSIRQLTAMLTETA